MIGVVGAGRQAERENTMRNERREIFFKIHL
jgi:hypothetical protein